MEYYVKLCEKGNIDIVQVDADGTSDKLRAWYKELDCDFIDIKEVEYLPDPYVLIFDDEFLLKEEPKVNIVASWMYGFQDHGQLICGDVLIGKTVESDEGLETTGYSKDEAMSLCVSIFKALGIAE